MNNDFWIQKWQRNEIAFHEHEFNIMLKNHFGKLNLARGARVFLPLCGKTRDLLWLLTQGYHVVGAELSELAIKQLFAELKMEPKVTVVGEFIHYQAMNIDVFVGDIFRMTEKILGPVDAIYDRAALVALGADIRSDYSAHLIKITKLAPQLLICFEYDQALMDGPPFSISKSELQQYYGDYRLQFVEGRSLAGGLKERVSALETAWLLL